MAPATVAGLPSVSAYAAVADSSTAAPDLLFDSAPELGLRAVRWRRSNACLKSPRKLADHVLSYCASGHAMTTISVDGVTRRFHQMPRSVIFVPAGHLVQWTVEAAREVVHVHVYIPQGVLPDLDPPRLGAPETPCLIDLRDPWLDGFFSLLIAEHADALREGSRGASRFLDDTGKLLFGHLASLLGSRADRQAAAAQKQRVSALRPFILRRIAAFVHDNLDIEIDLQRLAQVASMSAGHLVRAFKQATGLTPYQYVLEKRLERACERLRDSTEPVSEIAHGCGFSSLSHFSAIFRAHRGLTPTEYRQRH
jgi:AraC family transcriptional regulator